MQELFKKKPYLSVALVFFIVYIFSLTFVYVEGDDASTVAYHALGRDADFQEPYSPYHGMMDFVLGFLPAHEPLLRYVSITLSAISALIFVILSLKLIAAWVPGESHKNLVYFIPLLPLIAPELLFFGLIYMPSTLAMLLILTGHLMARQAFSESDQNPWKFILSLLLYGLGASFRWDVAIYGIVIFADIFFIVWNKQQWNFPNLLKLGIWSVLAIVSVILFIYISGYPPIRIVEVITWAKDYLGAKEGSTFKRIGVLISLLTPAFLFCLGVGLIRLIAEKKWPFVILAVAGFLPKIYLGFTYLPKALIMVLPGLFLVVYYGFDFIWKKSASYLNYADGKVAVVKMLFLSIVALPWIVGVKINTGTSSRGPGFEISYKENSDFDKTKSLDTNLSISGIKPGVFSGGFPIPTPEGPRPVWGYGAVFMGGWRALVKGIDDERDQVILLSQQENLPVLQNNDYKLLLVNLLRNGYVEPRPVFEHDLYKIRTLKKDDSTMQLFHIKSQELNHQSTLLQISEMIGHQQFICWFLSGSDIISLKNTYPGQVQILGPFSARFDLSSLN